jgi:hypothetical protein
MSDEQDSKQEKEPRVRKFQIARRVKEKMPETHAEQALREAETDDADKGTPEMDLGVRHGCNGCLKVTLLFFVIMFASILVTCALRRQGV